MRGSADSEVVERLVLCTAELDEALEMDQRVPKGCLDAAACGDTVVQRPEDASVRRIVDANDHSARRRFRLDAKVEATPDRVCAHERDRVSRDESVDLEELFRFTGDRAAEGNLAC